MKRILLNKLCILFFVILVAYVICPTAFSAEPAIPKDWGNSEPCELHSIVMEVSQAERYLIVGEQRIDLIDMKSGVERFRTMIRNSQGKAIPLLSLHKGNMVFVRGFRLTDGRIMAREIYRLPRSVQTRKALQKYDFYRTVPTWEPVK
jgi:hypothetical protein